MYNLQCIIIHMLNLCSIPPHAAIIFKPLSVAIMAEVMMQDAWNYFSSGGSSAPADKVSIFEKNDIHRRGRVSYLIQ